ncbi:MAG: DUF2336 domain-containing protein [Xanthobacteraceae bacterium]
MTLSSQAVLAELDAALPAKPDSWRSAALRRIVDLFISGAALYGDEHVAVFDEVIVRLIEKMDRLQLAELSNRLAPVPNSPAKVLGRLVRHSDAAVRGPILEHASALPDADLVEIADKDRVDPNLLAKIAARPHLRPAVTDVLLKRGNKALQRKIIDNHNALISEEGFARVITGLNGDKNLATAIAARNDVPAELRVWLTKTLSE